MAEYRASFPSSYASVSRARRALVHFARFGGLAGDALEDFEIAIGEALANAAEHGHRSGSQFGVRAEVIDGDIRVEIEDGGPGFEGWDAPECVKPSSNAPRGFGILIMRKLMDRVEYGARGSRILLVKKLVSSAVGQQQRKA
jgi:anti-sigma regulatory factor (Ser/Thr protein kinase)